MNLRVFLPKFAIWIYSIKKDQDKVGLAIIFIENAGIRYGYGFILENSPKDGVVVLTIITQ